MESISNFVPFLNRGNWTKYLLRGNLIIKITQLLFIIKKMTNRLHVRNAGKDMFSFNVDSARRVQFQLELLEATQPKNGSNILVA